MKLKKWVVKERISTMVAPLVYEEAFFRRSLSENSKMQKIRKQVASKASLKPDKAG